MSSLPIIIQNTINDLKEILQSLKETHEQEMFLEEVEDWAISERNKRDLPDADNSPCSPEASGSSGLTLGGGLPGGGL